MRVHPAVLLAISDYCAQDTQPPRLCGPLFGTRDTAIACAKQSDASLPAAETLDLLRKTSPQLQIIAWFYVGHGLAPERISAPPSATLVLIDVAASPPVIKAFCLGSEIELRLESDAASETALENAVDFGQAHNERRAKLALRDGVRRVKAQLRSDNPQDVSDALYKYAMLKKVYELQRTAQRYEDDFMYELLAEVVTKSDAQYRTRRK